MPFKSEAQRRWMYVNHPEMAKRWESHTLDKKLPEHTASNKKDKPLHEYIKKHRDLKKI